MRRKEVTMTGSRFSRSQWDACTFLGSMTITSTSHEAEAWLLKKVRYDPAETAEKFLSSGSSRRNASTSDLGMYRRNTSMKSSSK